MLRIRTLIVTGLAAGCFASAGTSSVRGQDQGKPSFSVNRDQLDLDGNKYFPDNGRLRVSLSAVKSGTSETFTLPITTSAPSQLTIAAGQYYDLTAIHVLYNRATLTTAPAGPQPTSVIVPGTLKDQVVTLISRATYTPHMGSPPIGPFASDPITVMIDTTPPAPKEPLKVQRLPNGTVVVGFTLADTDLDANSLKAADAFVIAHDVESTGTGETARALARVRPSKPPTYDSLSNEIRFELGDAEAGKYTITFKQLADRVGNKTDESKPITLEFQVPAGRVKGEHIAFPEFLPPGNKDVDFNPGHKVETRTARLYYNRDAHRIAEIINRNTKHLNQAGFDAAQRLAARARKNADTRTDERRAQENIAVQAAQEARETRARIEQVEHDLQDAAIQSSAIRVRRGDLEAQLNALNQTIGTNQPSPEETQRRTELQTRINDTTAALNQVDGLIVRMNDDARNLRSTLLAQQQAEIDARNLLNKIEAQEERARQEQFRLEVAAGLADRDTYAAGEITSIDPVTQVSITVAGEGVIHLRGPIKGINKIRRMINDLDAPVGQVKVGIHTIQVNGEHADRMELVYEDIEKYVAHSRFLTNQAAQLFRKAVAQVATAVATKANDDPGWVVIPPDCEQFCIEQNIRDYKYLFAFFGSDFIAELCRMDSELIRSENKLLSLNSMDTMSLSGALYVTALADNPIRMHILRQFDWLVRCELPQREVTYYKALTQTRHADPCHDKIARKYLQPVLDLKDAHRLKSNAKRSYHFPNLISFFESQFMPGEFAINEDPPYMTVHTSGKGTLNNVQYATLRMAQALKAQLVAEMDFINLVQERSLLQREEGEIAAEAARARDAWKTASDAKIKASRAQEHVMGSILKTIEDVITRSSARIISRISEKQVNTSKDTDTLRSTMPEGDSTDSPTAKKIAENERRLRSMEEFIAAVKTILNAEKRAQIAPKLLRELREQIDLNRTNEEIAKSLVTTVVDQDLLPFIKKRFGNRFEDDVISRLQMEVLAKQAVEESMDELRSDIANLDEAERYELEAQQTAKEASDYENEKKKALFAQRMLDQFIDEQEERSVELQEAMRSHASNVDNYLKRLAIALEDDINAQFYNPAWEKIRRTGTSWDVNLGQIETTTILPNNRTFAKVDPQATFEFDLPKRDIFITEAMEGAKALATDYGALLQDSTFLAASSMLSGQPATGLPNSVTPTQEIPGIPGQQPQKLGAALEALIPDPAIYKFETGTGFEIRPVIQPDGHSIVYNFDYMYTTNVREPVRADEKHLGRVKRHFVHTDVQTSSYELREVSRYTVALKASRTDRGVPLLEDIPVAGILFRPLPSDESALQTNIILASSTIYPTMYDLMGLRWSPYADEIGSCTLAAEKQEHIEHRRELRNHLLDITHKQVYEHIGYAGHPALPSILPDDTKVEDIPPGEPKDEPLSDPQSRSDIRSRRSNASRGLRIDDPDVERPATASPALPPIPGERTSGKSRAPSKSGRSSTGSKSKSRPSAAAASARFRQPARTHIQQVEFEPPITDEGDATDRSVEQAGYETLNDVPDDSSTQDDTRAYEQRAGATTTVRKRALRVPRITFGKR